MIQVRQTTAFASWIVRLRDDRARMRRLQLGNPGDVMAVGGGVSELRID